MPSAWVKARANLVCSGQPTCRQLSTGGRYQVRFPERWDNDCSALALSPSVSRWLMPWDLWNWDGSPLEHLTWPSETEFSISTKYPENNKYHLLPNPGLKGKLEASYKTQKDFDYIAILNVYVTKLKVMNYVTDKWRPWKTSISHVYVKENIFISKKLLQNNIKKSKPVKKLCQKIFLDFSNKQVNKKSSFRNM